MAILDNAIWLTGPGGTAVSGNTVISEGGQSTTVDATFTANAWDASQNGYGVSEFGAFGLTSPISADYLFSQPVQNLSFDLQHVNSSGSTYDDQFVIIGYDENGDQIPAADIIAGLSGVDDETITIGSGGEVIIDADGGTSNDITVNIPGQVSRVEVTYEPGPDGTQTGGAGIGDLSFDIVSADPLDDIVEGTANDDLIDASYTGDPEGDMVDAGDSTGAVTGNPGSDDDYIDAGAGNDTVDAGDGTDTVLGGTGDDSVRGQGGNDSLSGEGGDDTLRGGAGNDTIDGGADDDEIYGGGGNDSLIGGAGADTLEGRNGDDELFGGDGDDQLEGDAGADTMDGGGGDDRFILENSLGNDSIIGGETAESAGDTLDLSAVTSDLTIDLSGPTDEAGTVTNGSTTASFEEIENIVLGSGADTVLLGDGSGSDQIDGFNMADSGDGSTVDQLDVSGLTSDGGTTPVTAWDVTITDTNGDGSGDAILTFPGGESITLVGVSPAQVDTIAELNSIGIPCFTPGTMIRTSKGECPVEDICVGDLVETADGGLQPVRWVGRRDLNAADLANAPHLRPVVIRKGAFGNRRKMLVSPQHGLVWNSAGGGLIRAKHAAEFLGGKFARVDRWARKVSYIHLMFDRHHLIWAEGGLTEAFYPGAQALKSLELGAQAELLELFPELAQVAYGDAPAALAYGEPARPYLRRRDLRALLEAA